MPEVDLLDLMQLYARRGIADWKAAPSELRRRASDCLGAEIADNDTEASVTINTLYNSTNANRLRFIPMPKHPKGGIERHFFVPIREKKDDGEETVAFDLFALVAAKNCLAFRFEPAHPPPSRHAYGHVQMSRSMLRKTVATKALPWIPDSYPAFPLMTSDPLKLFLSMTTAVHGYIGGSTTILQEIFQAASRAAHAAPYIAALKTMLN